MAQYWYDIPSLSVASGVPPGWVQIWQSGTWSVVSNSGVSQIRGDYNFNDGDRRPGSGIAPSYFYVPSGDWEIYARGFSNDDNFFVGPAVLFMTTTPAQGYVGIAMDNGSAQLRYTLYRYARYDVAATENFNQPAGQNYTANTIYHLRMGKSGTTFRLKGWTGTVGNEPAGWLVSVTDLDLGAGYLGIGSGASGGYAQYEAFSIGTGADVAPTSYVISSQPQSREIYSGSSAYLNIWAPGATSYQWQDNRSGSFANVIDGTGGTTANYTTAVLTTSDTGRQYRCNVSDGTTPLTSSAATITVDPAPPPGSAGQFDPEIRLLGWF